MIGSHIFHNLASWPSLGWGTKGDRKEHFNRGISHKALWRSSLELTCLHFQLVLLISQVTRPAQNQCVAKQRFCILIERSQKFSLNSMNIEALQNWRESALICVYTQNEFNFLLWITWLPNPLGCPSLLSHSWFPWANHSCLLTAYCTRKLQFYLIFLALAIFPLGKHCPHDCSLSIFS